MTRKFNNNSWTFKTTVLLLLNTFRGLREAGPNPSSQRVRAGYTLDSSPVHHQRTITLRLRSIFNGGLPNPACFWTVWRNSSTQRKLTHWETIQTPERKTISARKLMILLQGCCFPKWTPSRGIKKKQQLQYVKKGTVCYHGGLTIILPTRGGAAKTFALRQIFYFIVRPHWQTESFLIFYRGLWSVSL